MHKFAIIHSSQNQGQKGISIRVKCHSQPETAILFNLFYFSGAGWTFADTHQRWTKQGNRGSWRRPMKAREHVTVTQFLPCELEAQDR